jgi:hypothetical protein
MARPQIAQTLDLPALLTHGAARNDQQPSHRRHLRPDYLQLAENRWQGAL